MGLYIEKSTQHHTKCVGEGATRHSQPNISIIGDVMKCTEIDQRVAHCDQFSLIRAGSSHKSECGQTHGDGATQTQREIKLPSRSRNIRMREQSTMHNRIDTKRGAATCDSIPYARQNKREPRGRGESAYQGRSDPLNERIFVSHRTRAKHFPHIRAYKFTHKMRGHFHAAVCTRGGDELGGKLRI